MTSKTTLNVIYTNIGRGHPYYLDGVVDYLRLNYSDQIELQISDVFRISGNVSSFLWKSIEFAYKMGSQGGIIGDLYSTLRKKRNPNQKGVIEKLLALNIRRFIKANRFPTLVAHPILIPMISDLSAVYYQHGEIAVPKESVVSNARKIFAPIDSSRERFELSPDIASSIESTGLCIDRKISDKSENNYQLRMNRFDHEENPVGAFFSSGAEPVEHLKKIIRAVNSLNCNDYKSIVICKKGGSLEKMVRRYFGDSAVISLVDLSGRIQNQNIIGLTFSGREEESQIESELMPFLDYFVAPSHERSNWAVGLGLPMFILHPVIGSFSPLNRQFLLDNGVAMDIETEKNAELFYDILVNCKNEKILKSMSQNGWGKYNLNGFDNIAKSIYSDLRTLTDND